MMSNANKDIKVSSELLCILRILFHKKRLIAIKFLCVVKLHRFLLCTKNGPFIVHIFFTRTLQKLNYIMIYCFFKMLCDTPKFRYISKLERFTLYTKNNHCTIHKILQGCIKNIVRASKHYEIWIYYHAELFCTLNILVVS